MYRDGHTLRLHHCIAKVCESLNAFYFHCVLLLSVLYSRLRCECAQCVFLNKMFLFSITVPIFLLVDELEGNYGFVIYRFSSFFVSVCLHTLALLLYLTINPGAHLCLCVPFHACNYVFMKQTKPICIQVLLPFKSFLCPGMACGLQVCAASWVTQRSPGFSCNLQLFIMHSTPLDYCRSRALHHCSLRREADADYRMS